MKLIQLGILIIMVNAENASEISETSKEKYLKQTADSHNHVEERRLYLIFPKINKKFVVTTTKPEAKSSNTNKRLLMIRKYFVESDRGVVHRKQGTVTRSPLMPIKKFTLMGLIEVNHNIANKKDKHMFIGNNSKTKDQLLSKIRNNNAHNDKYSSREESDKDSKESRHTTRKLPFAVTTNAPVPQYLQKPETRRSLRKLNILSTTSSTTEFLEQSKSIEDETTNSEEANWLEDTKLYTKKDAMQNYTKISEKDGKPSSSGTTDDSVEISTEDVEIINQTNQKTFEDKSNNFEKKDLLQSKKNQDNYSSEERADYNEFIFVGKDDKNSKEITTSTIPVINSGEETTPFSEKL